MTDTFICEKCGEPGEEMGDHENCWCMDCYSAWCDYQIAYYRPIYEGEKAAGLHWKEDE